MRTKLFILPLLVILLASLLSMAAVPAPAATQAAQGTAGNLIQVGQVGGVTSTVVFSAGQLYFNVGPRIVRMAASNAEAPKIPAVYGDLLPGIPVDLKVANGFVYAAMGNDGIAIVSASTLKPVSAQVLPGGDFAYAVAVGSQRLYVAAGSSGIIAYDLGSVKNTLTHIQTRTFSSSEYHLTDVETMAPAGSTDEYLFAAGNHGGILKFDISASPFLGATFTASEEHEINAISLSDSYIYATDEDGFEIFKVSDLSFVGEVDLEDEDPAWVSISNIVAGEVVYVTNDAGGIDTLDVSNPAAPAKVNSTPFATASMAAALYAVRTAGTTYLYVADWDAGLSIASATNAAPAGLHLYSPGYLSPESSVARAVAGAAHQAFVFTESSKLQTIDSGDPGSLKAVGTGIPVAEWIHSMTAYKNWLLASAGTSGLLRYGINPGSELTNQGSFDTDGVAYAADVSWPYAVVADGENGLLLVNIDGTMSLTGSAPAPDADSDFRSVDVQGAYAYVMDNNGTFRIYDLTDPAAPAARGTLYQEGVLDMKVSGKFAFLACGEGGVKVVDISIPDAPAFINGGVYDTSGLAQSLAVYNSNLFVADGEAGVHMLAVRSTGQLDLVSTANTSGVALQLSLVPQDYLYVADEYGSLAVVDTSLFFTNKIFLPVIVHPKG